MASLDGKWSYRSFRDGTKDTPPEIAVIWAPRGEMVAETDAAGNVTGTLTFALVMKLTITGSITPAAGHLLWERPEGIVLTAEGPKAIYKVQGYFIDDDHVVGTVVGVQNDLGGQPDGTNGPFALFRTP